MEINNTVENTLFEEIEEYVIQNTNLTITEPCYEFHNNNRKSKRNLYQFRY